MNSVNTYFTVGLFLVILTMSSCNTKKNMIYLRDLENEMMLTGLPVTPPDLRIKPNDNLYISLKTINPEINELFTSSTDNGMGGSRYESAANQHILGYRVDNRGIVMLPIIGEVPLGGLTLKEAEEAVKKKSEEYINDATIQVKLLNYRVNILGEVRNPGLHYNYNNSLNILEAIGLAGGITEFAGLDEVTVVRQTLDGTKSYKIDLTQKKAFASEAFYIYPNDMIYIDSQSLKNTRLNSGMYSLFLSSISTALVIYKFFE